MEDGTPVEAKQDPRIKTKDGRPADCIGEWSKSNKQFICKNPSRQMKQELGPPDADEESEEQIIMKFKKNAMALLTMRQTLSPTLVTQHGFELPELPFLATAQQHFIAHWKHREAQ